MFKEVNEDFKIRIRIKELKDRRDKKEVPTELLVSL